MLIPKKSCNAKTMLRVSTAVSVIYECVASVLLSVLEFHTHSDRDFMVNSRFVRQSAWAPTGISWYIQVHLVNLQIYFQMAMKVVYIEKVFIFFLFSFVEIHVPKSVTTFFALSLQDF